MELLARLENIEFNVKQLKKKCDALESENVELKEKLANLNGVVQSKQTEINNLKETNKISKLAGSVSSNTDNEDLKNQIDSLISEIDLCLQIVKK